MGFERPRMRDLAHIPKGFRSWGPIKAIEINCCLSVNVYPAWLDHFLLFAPYPCRCSPLKVCKSRKQPSCLRRNLRRNPKARRRSPRDLFFPQLFCFTEVGQAEVKGEEEQPSGLQPSVVRQVNEGGSPEAQGMPEMAVAMQITPFR